MKLRWFPLMNDVRLKSLARSLGDILLPNRVLQSALNIMMNVAAV